MKTNDGKDPAICGDNIETILEDIKKNDSKLSKDDLLRDLLLLFYSSQDGMYIVDADGVTLRVNKAFEEITGIPADKMINQNVNDLVRDGYFDQSVAAEVLLKKKPVTIIQKYQNGKTALVTGTPNINSEGKIINIVSNIRDISELDKLYEDLSTKERIIEQYSEYISGLDNYQEEGIIAYSESMKNVLKAIRQASKSDSSILFLGESGVGKSMFARYLWKHSGDISKPFITVNCAAIPQNLMESELFGYESGAFTGAEKGGKEGLIQAASGGILFLDEVSQIPYNLQAKLLVFLESNEVTRIGAVKPTKVNVRIVSAANENLEALVEAGKFREDLYYRLNVIPIHIKPVRERKEDILPTVMFFLNELNEKNNTDKHIDKKLMDKLVNNSWPGNIRQIKNIIERMYVMDDDQSLTLSDLPEDFINKTANLNQLYNLPSNINHRIKELEHTWIKEAVEKSGSIRGAAKLLGIPPTTLFRKYNSHK
jgi:PAS domain S-box-containing protein